MKAATSKMALEALKLIDPELKFMDWQDLGGKSIGFRLREYVAALEADLAQAVEPVAYELFSIKFSNGTKLVYEKPVNLPSYVSFRPLFAAPQEAAAPAPVNSELLSALISIVDYDTYETEYDGEILSICHGCGTQDGTHSPKCAFVVARAAIAKGTRSAT